MNCIFPGCKGRIHGRGNKCPAHARQMTLHGKMTKVRPLRNSADPMSRITGRYAVTDCGCWEWTANKSHGYGYLMFKGQRHQAHRFVYELLVGPIPDGAILCHTCDNPPCINPAHMFLGTHKTNAEDKVQKKRHPRNLATECKHGHPYTPETSYVSIHPKSGRSYRRCRICNSENNKKARSLTESRPK